MMLAPARIINHLRNHFASAGEPPALQTGSIAVALVFLICITLLSCSKKQEQQSAQQSQRQKYNVVLISIDTLRSDYLKLYNPNGLDTPALQGLAQDSILFRNVISQIPYTLPSHCSMLTGVYPIAHKVRDNVHDVLPKNLPTLAEVFQKSGYQTAGFVGSMVLSRQTGISRGFEYYDDFFSLSDTHAEDVGGIERRADDVLSSFEHWYESRDQKKNFFSFIHFYDPHSPYDPPPQFMPAEKDGKDLYKGEIRYVDSVIGKLFAYLHSKNIWDKTVIVVTSDHGEMLGEHQEIGHGFFVYRAALEVPLLLRIPHTSKKEVADIVELIDIAPTLIDLTASSRPATMQGETLLPLISGNGHKKNRAAFAESYFAATQLGVSPLLSYQDDTFKYIESSKPELYNLKNDPNESNNLIQEKKDLAGQMRQRTAGYKSLYSHPEIAKSQRSVSSEEAEQFAALGYLGGRIPESSWNKAKDPKDYIGVWNAELQAAYLVGGGQYTQALDQLKKVESAIGTEDKNLPFAIALAKSKCYGGLGDFKKAEDVLNALGGAPEALNALARVYTMTGRLEKANQLYQQALDRQFSYFTLNNYVLFLRDTGNKQAALTLLHRVQSTTDLNQSRPYLSEMYGLVEDYNDAEPMLLTLIQQRPWEVKWYLQLSDAYQAQGQKQKALTLLTNNYDRFSSNLDYLIRLGLLYGSAGLPGNELDTFKQMLRVDPNDPRGYFYCAKALLDQKQDINAIIGLTVRGLQLGPDRPLQIVGHKILAQAYQLAGKPQDSEREAAIARKLERGA